MDPYVAIAPFYDMEHDVLVEDVEFFRQIVQSGPVLEVGVGTGRIMQPLLEAGWDVWGIDPSPAMIEQARERVAANPRAHLVQQSAIDLDLPTRFETILLPLNVLSHFRDTDAQLAALAALRRHSAQGAMLLVDLVNPLTMADRGGAGEVRQRFSRRIDGRSISGWSAAWDDEAEQVLTLHLWYDEMRSGEPVRRTETDLEMRYLYRYELELLLRQSGFRIADTYGGYDLTPYSDASRRLLCVAFAD